MNERKWLRGCPGGCARCIGSDSSTFQILIGSGIYLCLLKVFLLSHSIKETLCLDSLGIARLPRTQGPDCSALYTRSLIDMVRLAPWLDHAQSRRDNQSEDKLLVSIRSSLLLPAAVNRYQSSSLSETRRL
ncbi:hypothetical protein BDW60DRAFT_189838 [Aspergillus nidulans var. acristatus]